MTHYRKKPVVIEAWRIGSRSPRPQWLNDALDDGGVWWLTDGGTMKIKTEEGVMLGQAGDWIIRGVEGELYPCKPQIFDQTYERVDAP